MKTPQVTEKKIDFAEPMIYIDAVNSFNIGIVYIYTSELYIVYQCAEIEVIVHEANDTYSVY